MKKHVFLFLAFIGTVSIFFSCKKSYTPPVDTGFMYGAFIVNEGAYNQNNGSISYIDLDSNYIINNLFSSINGRPLGDVVQSFAVDNDKGLIVVNHSAKVEVVDMKTFVSLGTITGCDYPRYALPVNDNEAWLSNGSQAGKVYVMDLTGMDITDSIDVGYGPEKMVQSDDKIFVANSGGWANDSTVSVIDVNSRKVVKTILTGDNPVNLVTDANGDIWVLCKGKVVYDQNWNVISETDSKLQKISHTTEDIEKSFIIGQKGDYFNPIRLAIGSQGNLLYFAEHDGIYRMSIQDTQVPDAPIIYGKFYGLAVDPASGMIYALDAGNFTGAGILYRYDPHGMLRDSAQAGIAPNDVYFSY